MLFALSNRSYWLIAAALWLVGCSQASDGYVFGDSDASVEEVFAPTEAVTAFDDEEGAYPVSTTGGEACGRKEYATSSCSDTSASLTGWPKVPIANATYSTPGWQGEVRKIGPGLANTWVTIKLERISPIGDPDLYVKKNGTVSESTYDCRPYSPTSPEYCAFYLDNEADYLTWGIDLFEYANTPPATVRVEVDARRCGVGTVYTGVASYQSAATGSPVPPPAMTCCDCEEGYVEEGGECCPAPVIACTKASDCASGFCVDGYCCDGACVGGCERCDRAGSLGRCRFLPDKAAGSPSCAPYVCNGTSGACPTSCANDATCASGLICKGGSCVAKATNGSACGANKECQSGQCADGICCNSACAGSCERCDAPGSKGSCTVSPAGTSSGSCGPYLCDGKSPACPSSCATDAGCSSDAFCAGGLCHPKEAVGSACRAGAECASGSCVDNTCCESACEGQCQRCDAPGSLGICTNVQGLPHGDRQACVSDGSDCGGVCDGLQPSCAYPGGDVVCREASCTGGVARGAGRCGGEGACVQGAVTCAPYACGEGGCRSSCGTGADCSPSAECVNGACVGALPNGASCAVSGECDSGACVDGVCCESACGGDCMSCALEGSRGLCRPSAEEGCVSSDDPTSLPAEEDDGCGCRVAGGARDGGNRAALAALALGFVAWRRRRAG